jgi:hypothetical protein
MTIVCRLIGIGGTVTLPSPGSTVRPDLTTSATRSYGSRMAWLTRNGAIEARQAGP